MASGSKKGRPRRRQPKSGERVSLGLRVTPELKEALDRAAEKSGRSQSQEAELRLERSFLDQRLMTEALELAYGRELAGILLTLAEAMKTTGEHAGFAAAGTLEGAKAWWNDPYAYQQVTQAVAFVLRALSPEGEMKLPRIAHMAGGPADLNLKRTYENLGEGLAEGILSGVRETQPSGDQAPRLRHYLGKLADRLMSKGRRQ